MFSNEIKLIHHTHLEEKELFEVGWFSKYLKMEDRVIAREINCFEMRIDGLKDNDELYFRAMGDLTRVAWLFLTGIKAEAFLVLVEHIDSMKSRIRSYKGLFPYKGQIKQEHFIEQEIETARNTSFLIGMAKITKSNKDECFTLAKDFLQSFFLISDGKPECVFNRGFLTLLADCLNTKGSISMDYMKIIPKCCSYGHMIMSFGWDARGDYVNIRLFYPSTKKSMIDFYCENFKNSFNYSAVSNAPVVD